jgi:ferredoxin
MDEEIRVFIDQNDCTGCGLCPTYSESDFDMGNNGLARVIIEGSLDPDANTETNTQPIGKIATNPRGVIEAAGMCPGECIYVDYAKKS